MINYELFCKIRHLKDHEGLSVVGLGRCYFPRYSAARGMKICRAI